MGNIAVLHHDGREIVYLIPLDGVACLLFRPRDTKYLPSLSTDSCYLVLSDNTSIDLQTGPLGRHVGRSFNGKKALLQKFKWSYVS